MHDCATVLNADEPKVTYVSELDQAQFSQFTDTVVGRARLEEELHQAHLLTPKKGAHGRLNAGVRGGWGHMNDSYISPGSLTT